MGKFHSRLAKKLAVSHPRLEVAFSCMRVDLLPQELIVRKPTEADYVSVKEWLEEAGMDDDDDPVAGEV